MACALDSRVRKQPNPSYEIKQSKQLNMRLWWNWQRKLTLAPTLANLHSIDSLRCPILHCG